MPITANPETMIRGACARAAQWVFTNVPEEDVMDQFNIACRLARAYLVNQFRLSEIAVCMIDVFNGLGHPLS